MAKAVANGENGDEPRRMHIISRRKLREFSGEHPEAKEALDHWYNAARRALWRTFSDVRATFGSADQVGEFVVFNIGGNKYRLIARIYYKDAVALIRHVLTHREYDRGDWKSGSESRERLSLPMSPGENHGPVVGIDRQEVSRWPGRRPPDREAESRVKATWP
jgi:mRNA interferase HigB